MSVLLSSNIAALAAGRKLNETSKSIAKVFERLSSGLRINKASDDAAGLSISSILKSDIRIYGQAIRNVNDGISVTNITGSALSELTSIVGRQLELAEQSANGTFSTTQRSALNKELNALVDEFNRIVANTTFNDINLLSDVGSYLSIQAGSGSNSSIGLTSGNDLARNKANLSFAGQGTFSEASTSDFETGDFNGDGYDDILFFGSAGVDSYLSNGNGGFTAAGNFSGATSGLGGGAVADFDNDGYADGAQKVISGNITVKLSEGNGINFTSIGSFSASSTEAFIEAGDFNGDGNADLITDKDVFFGNGDGTFQSGKTFALGVSGLVDIATADFNSDGFDDLYLMTGGNSYYVQGNGDGTFQSAVTIVFPRGAIGDFNGDGYLDISEQNGTPSVILGNGDGTFSSAQTITGLATNENRALALDANGDGILDIISNDIATPTTFSVHLGQYEQSADIAHMNISTRNGALDSITILKDTLSRISLEQANIGAFESRLSVAANNLSTLKDVIAEAASRITDVDVAEESANLVRLQVLQQATASVLAQANLQPELALKLMKP